MCDKTKDINVLIVEDEVFIAKEIQKHIVNLGYKVAACVYNSDKALDILHNRKVDFAVLDINIQGSRNGIELAGIINEKYKIPFIYLTSYADKSTIENASKTLPYGYILKPFDEKDLLSSIEMAIFKHSSEQKTLLPDLSKINSILNISMSEREHEIIGFLINGDTLQQIAVKLFLSENTIKSHVRRIYNRLSVHNRVELTRKMIAVNEWS